MATEEAAMVTQNPAFIELYGTFEDMVDEAEE